MKKMYLSPEAEVVEFDVEDVITTSWDSSLGTPTQDTGDEDDWEDWN